MFCSQCGTKACIGARFCSECGAPAQVPSLSSSPPPPSSRPSSSRPSRPPSSQPPSSRPSSSRPSPPPSSPPLFQSTPKSKGSSQQTSPIGQPAVPAVGTLGLSKAIIPREALARSRGQGFSNSTKDDIRPVLDPIIVCACKDYVKMWCREHKKPIPDDPAMNKAVTRQIDYSRKDLKKNC